MVNLKIKRPSEANKSKIVTFRLTADEYQELEHLKNNLEFQSTRNLVLFCMDVVGMLYKWRSSNWLFFIGKPKEKKYKEVEFEFKPHSKQKKGDGK